MASDLDITVPDCYKQVRPYILIAKEHDTRDPIVSYYARRYAMETAMQMKQPRSPETKAFLFGLMDVLEKCKKTIQDAGNDEVVSSDVVGSVHVENYAIKIFLFADNEDRASRFNKNTVKSFYKAGLLFDIMQTFGELSDELATNRKYAKWKATYLNNCLKKGETPHPGPLDEEGGVGAPVYSQPPNTPADGVAPPPAGFAPSTQTYPPPQQPMYPPPHQPGPSYPPQAPSASYPPPASNLMPPGAHAPPTTPEQSGGQIGIPGPTDQSTSGVQLSISDFAKAQKFCKFAGSALQYEDVPTAVENLEKALQLLKIGKVD